VRRRDFAIGLLLAATAPTVRAEEPAKQHRIAIIAAGPVARIHDPTSRAWQTFWEELRRLGDIEGQNLTVELYSGEERPEGYPDLARKIVNRSPEVIVAISNAIAQAIRSVTDTMPVVWIGGDAIEAGLAGSLARPGGSVTGVTVYPGAEFWGKRLQIFKDAAPSASKVAYLDLRWQLSAAGQEQRREASRQLQISLVDVLLEEATPSEIQRAFAEIAREQADAVLLSGSGDLLPFRKLIVRLAEESRLPAIYPWREYAEAGGLMAYASDDRELLRHMADDVHQILNGAKPGDIPIYQPTKFELLINLKAAKAIGLTIPPSLLALADEVLE